ncbi:MAG TPA: ComEC/Rec2 family competence protein [Candidatus Saccharimonadales bacterium]|nr:ComEC/Rec2 family competence protein [Candidatus Saccharimonadales bacterium]
MSIYLGKIFTFNFTIQISKVWTVTLFTGAFLIYKSKHKSGRLLTLLICTGLIFISSSNFQNSLKTYDQLFGRQLSLIAIVQDDAAYNQYGDYEFNITKVKFIEDQQYLPGRIRIRTKQNIAVYRGDSIFVEGKLKPALGSRTGSISYANIEVLDSSPSTLEKVRLKFFASVYSSLPEPHASLGIGFLAGVRSSITKDFQDQLSRVGLTHIIAVSGYNLTILVLAVSKLGKKLSKYQRALISLSLIFTFLLITGFSPSVVRAAVVCIISISCSFVGRKISPLNLILISAAITSIFNPTYLLEDIGWWLSFLAFFGVLILAPAITDQIYRNKDKRPGLIISMIIESVCAQIMTAPLIAHVFGTFSVISILANILVVSWIPFIMLLVLIVGVIGMYDFEQLRFIALLPKVILTPIIIVIERLSSLSWASIQLKFSQLGMVVCYLLIGVLIRLLNKKIVRRE